MFAALRGVKKTRTKRVGVKSWRDYDVDFESRIARYRRTARLLWSAADTMSADRHGDLLAIATELEGSPTVSHGFGPRCLLRGPTPTAPKVPCQVNPIILLTLIDCYNVGCETSTNGRRAARTPDCCGKRMRQLRTVTRAIS